MIKGFQRNSRNLENPFLEREPQLVHIILKKLLDQKAIELLNVQNTSEIVNLMVILCYENNMWKISH